MLGLLDCVETDRRPRPVRCPDEPVALFVWASRSLRLRNASLLFSHQNSQVS
jgi:hypothetical protein